MIKVPVTIGFDNSNIIGVMEIDETKLPPMADFCFALGYIVNKCHIEDSGVVVVTDFDLKEISIVNDLEYHKFVEKEYNVK